VPIWRAFCGGFECYYGAMRLVLDPFRLLHFPCRLPEPTAARRDRVSSRREPCSARTARRQSAALRRVYSGPLPLVRLADKRAARLTLLKVVAGLGRCVRSRASIPSAVPLSQTNRPLLPPMPHLARPFTGLGAVALRSHTQPQHCQDRCGMISSTEERNLSGIIVAG